MTEILLIRHAQATVNVGDLAFGNKDAPLTEKGIEQTIGTRQQLIEQYSIIPEEYNLPVLASEYQRAYKTAQYIGFPLIHRSGVINESEIYKKGALTGVDVIKKHVDENGWTPDEEIKRAKEFINAIREGSLPYRIVFSHGMIIAAIVSELNRQGASLPFDNKRGFVPLQASITPVSI